MKILMPVLHYYPVIGGLETWTQNIAEGLSNRVEFFVITGKVLKEPTFEIKNGVKISRTSLFTLKNLSYSSPVYILTALPFIFFKSLHLIKKEKVDIVHCQGFLSGLLGYFLSKLTNFPFIITAQSAKEHESFWRKLVFKNAKICIVSSSAIKKHFENVKTENIAIIPNGIDLQRFQNLNRKENRDKLGLKNEFVIMIIARLEKRKGIDYLIKAVLDAQHRIPNIKLLIIGEGSYRRNLESLVQALNLMEKVQFLGEIPNKEIPNYLSVADCFVLSSVDIQEGFGIVILEAQAARIPVIGTEVGGISDIIEDRKNGILVEPRNSEAIAEVIVEIFSKPQLSQSLINNAMVKLSKYSWNNITQAVYDIYQKLIS